MLILAIFLTIVSGFLLVNRISSRFNLCEKIGLSFPVGLFCVTLIMILSDAVGIPLTRGGTLAGIILLLILLILFSRKIAGQTLDSFKNSFKISFGKINFIWLFFIALIVYVEFMNFQKCMFWPAFDRDSLAGFETIGYVISRESTLKGLTLFQKDYIGNIHDAGSYITYAPMVQLSYAFVYLMGAETSKIVPGLIYASFLLTFYGVTKRVIGKTGAALITFFVLLTPEMLAFSSLSMTNVIHAVFASLGIIYLAVWFRNREMKDLILSAILLAAGTWCRTDGIVFTGAALCVLFVDMLRKKTYRESVLFLVVATSTVIIWTLFMKIFGLTSESIAIVKPFWDPEKIGTIWKYMFALYKNTTYYGISLIVFVVGFAINIWFILKERNNVQLLAMILLAMLFYMIVLYQIDYKWDLITNVLSYSAKRFMFCFIPLFWFYAFSNRIVLLGLDKLEEWLSLKRGK